MRRALGYGALGLVVTVFLFPLYWMVVTSLKDNKALFRLPPEWWPKQPMLNNYWEILASDTFSTLYRNSLIVAAGTVALTLIVSVLAAYSFSRFRFPGSNLLFMAFLSTQMFPGVVLLISLYTIYSRLRLLNTYSVLIIGASTVALPFSIWMLKSFFDGVPREIEEAAMIDGCSRIEVLYRIVLPLVKPGITAVAINAFLLAWDDFIFALTLVNRKEMRTLTPGIVINFVGEFANNWASLMAVAVLSAVPIVVGFIFLQRYFVAGLTSGGVKG